MEIPFVGAFAVLPIDLLGAFASGDGDIVLEVVVIVVVVVDELFGDGNDFGAS